MKFLLALVMALPLTSFASNYAACDLFAFHYTTSDWTNYTMIKSERISNTWNELSNSNVVLKDSVHPVSYSVEFNLDGTIKGALGIKIDQPGPSTRGTVSIFEQLDLQVEDLFNGGKTIYKLSCGLDK